MLYALRLSNGINITFVHVFSVSSRFVFYLIEGSFQSLANPCPF